MGTIIVVSYWASEASPTLGCSIEISRDWAREASPTLGCSSEISRDIAMSVCLKETHTKNTYVKNAWAELHGPNTRMLKVCFGQLKPNLKQTELQKSKNRGKKGWIRPENKKTEKRERQCLATLKD